MFHYFQYPNLKKLTKKRTSHIIREFAIDVEYKLDNYSLYRGVFHNKYEFIVTYLLASVGLGNIVNFPNLVYKHGGAVFLVLYFILSIAFGLPMFILETGLAQFYSVGESKLFRIVPYFRGLGWSIHILNLIIFIPYSVNIEWFLSYIFYSALPKKPPWSYCIEIPGIKCVEIGNVSVSNSGETTMSPTMMFLQFEVQGSRRMSDGVVYNYKNALDGFRGLQLISIASVWGLVAVFTWFFTKMYVKFSYMILIIAGSILVILTFKAMFLKGSLWGIYHFLNPNLKKLFTGDSLRDATCQVMFSLCIMKSCTSFASLNPFNFDFFKCSFFIILGDFSFSFLSGLLVFSTLGYLSVRLNMDIEDLIKNDNTFINILDASVLNKEMKIWIFIFMFMVVLLGVSTISVVCSAFTISFIDYNPNFMNESEVKKWFVCLFICLILGSVSLFFSLKGSIVYLHVFTHRIDDISLPLTMFSEVVLVQYVYGTKRLRLEIKMMIGYTYNVIWVFCSVSIVPSLIIFVLLYSNLTESSMDEPLWATILSYVITVLPLLPLILSFISQLFTNLSKEKGLSIIKVGLRTSKVYGPYYKSNWLLSKYYQRKLVIVRKDPEFLKTIRDTENLEEILNRLKNLYVEPPPSPQDPNDLLLRLMRYE